MWGIWRFSISLRGEELAPPFLSPPSQRIPELWISPSPRGNPILEHPFFSDLTVLRGLFPQLKTQSELSQQIEGTPIKVAALRGEFQRLFKKLYQTRPLPFRYWFVAPTEGDPLGRPIYSRRRLPTGLMEAAFDLCYINRNWDGNDRFEDLTEREIFLDSAGEIAIYPQSLAAFLAGELRSWRNLLSALPDHLELEPRLERADQLSEILALGSLNVAERARRRFGFPNYHPRNLQRLGELWKKMLTKRGNFEDLALLLTAYFAEILRSQFPSVHYRRFEKPPDKREQIEDSLFREWRGVGLYFPYGLKLKLFYRAERAYFFKHNFSWNLIYESTASHLRQSEALLELASHLASPSAEHRRAALQILLAIGDLRAKQLLAFYLEKEEKARALSAILSALTPPPPGIRLPLGRLLQICLSPNSERTNAQKALELLAAYLREQFPTFIEKFIEKLPRSLYPTLRQILKKQTSSQNKQLLKKLSVKGVSNDNPQQNIPSLPPAPLLAELVENSSNPKKLQVAIKILSSYPASEELEQIGQALTDPDPTVRLAVIGLIGDSSSSEQLREQLKMRSLFEENPLCKRALKNFT